MEDMKKFSDDLGPQFEMYKRLFDLSLQLNLRGACKHSTNLRLPEGINNKLDMINLYFVKTFGLNVSKNDLIIFCLTLVLNMEQNKKKEFYSKRDGQSLESFFAYYDNELSFEVQKYLLEQQIKKYKK